MGVKLKPCPFCGSIDIYETHSQEDTLGTKNPEIFCNSCKIIFSIEDDSPYTDYDEDYAYRKAKTVEAWNMRPIEEIDLVRCGECKWWDSDDGNIGYCHAEKHCYRSKNWEIDIHRTYKKDHYCSDGERRNDE